MGRSKPDPSLRMSAFQHQIDGNMGGRNIVRAVLQRRANPVAAFAAHGQAHSVKVVFLHFDAGDPHFDDVGVNAVNGGTQGLIEHREHQWGSENGRFLLTS